MSFTIQGLDHVVIRTTDIDRMIKFYSEVVRCPLERSVESAGLYQMRAGSALIDLVPVDSEIGKRGGAAPGKDAHNMDHFCLMLEDFDEAAIRAHLAEHGVEAGPTENRYGAAGRGPSIYIRDPDGNTVELKGREE